MKFYKNCIVLFFSSCVLLVSGCSAFHTHIDYDKAVEARPLEIPPDLDSPPTAGELLVPGTNNGPKSDTVNVTPPSSVITSASAVTTQAIGGDGLHIADSVGNAWQRVGVALERSKIGNLAARDETNHTYSVNVTGEAPVAKSNHWFKRIFQHGNSKVQRQILITVTEENNGARINIEGDASDAASTAAAARVVAVLRERLL